jgi:N-methylhydantoinase A
MRHLVAADTGGTFTDIAVHDTRDGTTRFGKTLTTYGDLVVGAMAGLEAAGATAADALVFTHGTTHVINSLIQRRGGRTALVTTRGFRDVLEIGRGNRADPFDLHYRRDPPLIPRDWRFEVHERLDARGNVLVALDEAEIEALAGRLRALDIEAVAISFLHAWRNPVHEEQAQRMLRELLPGVFVSRGSELTRELMEYERTATVAANAYVGARMHGYIEGFRQALAAGGFRGRFHLMGSSGGVMPADAALVRPVSLVESGPVGGCAGAAAYAAKLGIERMIAFDMGGTTAKCALIEGASFEVVSTYYVNGYERGFPIRTPVLDIVEVGAGGGSIAWLDAQGRMRLGPRSAGSEPGPIAFGRGGTEPTVTDANVVLGRLGGGSFMDGALPLDARAAAEGIGRLARPLGYEGGAGIDRVAQGILDLACVAMANAIKEITIERGRDVRDFVLFAFGGGGPIFATELARGLGIAEVVIPPHPGMFSSFGMLLAPMRLDVDHSFMMPLSDEAMARARAQFEAMVEGARATVARDLPEATPRLRYEADMSYVGQSHTVRVALDPTMSASECGAAFERAYRTRYGHLNEAARVQLAVLRVVCEVRLPHPEPRATATTGAGRVQAGPGFRQVHFADAGGRIATPIHRRDALAPGARVEGPAIIEEYSSTTVLAPGESALVGELGELRLRVAPRSGGRRP